MAWKLRKIFSLVCLIFPAIVAGHPMGNFSTNRYATFRVDPPGVVHLQYRIDYAEIPSVQELRQLDADGDEAISPSERMAYLADKSADLSSRLTLTAGGRAIPLTLDSSDLKISEGAGGLRTLLVMLDFHAPFALATLPVPFAFVDDNYSAKPGWREAAVLAGSSLSLSVPGSAKIAKAQLLDQAMAASDSPVPWQLAFTLVPSGNVPAAVSRPVVAPPPPPDHLAALLRERSFPLLGLALLLAFTLGAFHAFSPGHGKTVVAAYLVGSRGTVPHALLLAFTVTMTHTIAVFVLAAVILLAKNSLPVERIYPYLSFVSGLTILTVGGSQLLRRYAATYTTFTLAQPASLLAHPHPHLPPDASVRGLIALGISGGLAPCPSALVVLLGCVSLHWPALGLAAVTSFSLGLAATLTALGITAVYLRNTFLKSRLEIHSPKLSMVSSILLTIIGLVLAVQSFGAL